MNSYLQMSMSVLSKSRSAMSAREILDAAYRLQLVPEHLFGKTQHKTLHARLSEEILRNRNKSVFTRTAPGRFALRRMSGSDGEVRGEYVAPQRSYQLKQFDIFCAEVHEVAPYTKKTESPIPFRIISALFKTQISLRNADKDKTLARLRLLVVIRFKDRFLTVTALDAADTGAGRSFGFLGYIKGNDANLFSVESFGVDTAAKRTIAEQSEAPMTSIEALERTSDSDALRCIWMDEVDGKYPSVVLFTELECRDPNEFLSYVPAHRSPRWTRVPAEINDLSSLEPISRKLMMSKGREAIL